MLSQKEIVSCSEITSFIGIEKRIVGERNISVEVYLVC